MDKKLTQASGSVVTGDRFWDRKADMALFKQKIDEGAHILVVAQRRIGKTSLLKEAAEQLNDTYVCLYVDLQDKSDAAGAHSGHKHGDASAQAALGKGQGYIF